MTQRSEEKKKKPPMTLSIDYPKSRINYSKLS